MSPTRRSRTSVNSGLTREDVIRIVYGDPRSPIQRFTQDSPVLADVWIAFAEKPGEPQDLLLTPFQNTLSPAASGSAGAERTLATPGKLAQQLRARLAAERKTARWKKWNGGRDTALDIAYNQSTVAARVWFDELVRVILPMSHWYSTRVAASSDSGSVRRPRTVAPPYDLIAGVDSAEGREALAGWLAQPESAPAHVPPDVLWAAQVIGIIAFEHDRRASRNTPALGLPPERAHGERPADRKARLLYFSKVAGALARTIAGMSPARADSEIYLVSLNRRVNTTVFRSTVAVKADAAARLFNVTCKDFTWAIIDSGIDASHPAFRRYQPPTRDQPESKPFPEPFERKDGTLRNNTRIAGTFDFTAIRRLLSMSSEGAVKTNGGVDASARKQLEQSLNNGREIDWSLLLDLLQCEPDAPPANPHGTHVAGILAADWRFDTDPEQTPLEQPIKGMCPDLNLYDLRVLGPDGGDEFSVMAALQFVRFLNLHRDVMAVHGVNLSLSIQHDVLNYACGRTPVCEECTRLIGAGVVVVAAAGNEGYQTLPESAGVTTRNAYQAISITDPGNAEAVITVGATHRDSPHTFGVSYFSSRGPTGDGRSKPDLVAPGEKIESSVPGDSLKRMDGTSMAAPHVSGAAALLMARHRELVGSPGRIKEILCRTATDLGREKYFQGSGMVDVLRALQSV
jgi:serine protease AprX